MEDICPGFICAGERDEAASNWGRNATGRARWERSWDCSYATPAAADNRRACRFYMSPQGFPCTGSRVTQPLHWLTRHPDGGRAQCAYVRENSKEPCPPQRRDRHSAHCSTSARAQMHRLSPKIRPRAHQSTVQRRRRASHARKLKPRSEDRSPPTFRYPRPRSPTVSTVPRNDGRRGMGYTDTCGSPAHCTAGSRR